MEATSSVINRRMDKEDMSHIHTGILLLLLLSCISRVWLCATTKMASHQAPLSLGVSRQEHWSGPPFSSPSMKVKSESEIVQTCLTLSDLMDCSLPGSSVHGICQARVLEWGAITFSEYTVYNSKYDPWMKTWRCGRRNYLYREPTISYTWIFDLVEGWYFLPLKCSKLISYVHFLNPSLSLFFFFEDLRVRRSN